MRLVRRTFVCLNCGMRNYKEEALKLHSYFTGHKYEADETWQAEEDEDEVVDHYYFLYKNSRF